MSPVLRDPPQTIEVNDTLVDEADDLAVALRKRWSEPKEWDKCDLGSTDRVLSMAQLVAMMDEADGCAAVQAQTMVAEKATGQTSTQSSVTEAEGAHLQPRATRMCSGMVMPGDTVDVSLAVSRLMASSCAGQPGGSGGGTPSIRPWNEVASQEARDREGQQPASVRGDPQPGRQSHKATKRQ